MLQPSSCYPLRRRPVQGYPADAVGRYPLLLHHTSEELRASLAAAPHLSMVRPDRLLGQQRGRLQVILLTEDWYAAHQAAVHLATLECLERGEYTPGELTALSAPAVAQWGTEPWRDAAGLILPAEAPELPQQLQDLLWDPSWRKTGIFLTVSSQSVDRIWLEDLQFLYGFQLCRVMAPDTAYLCRVMTDLAADLELELREVDVPRVVERLRQCRGSRFCERDLEALLLWCIQRQDVLSSPLRTAELLYRFDRPWQERR